MTSRLMRLLISETLKNWNSNVKKNDTCNAINTDLMLVIFPLLFFLFQSDIEIINVPKKRLAEEEENKNWNRTKYRITLPDICFIKHRFFDIETENRVLSLYSVSSVRFSLSYLRLGGYPVNHSNMYVRIIARWLVFRINFPRAIQRSSYALHRVYDTRET